MFFKKPELGPCFILALTQAQELGTPPPAPLPSLGHRVMGRGSRGRQQRRLPASAQSQVFPQPAFPTDTD